MAKAWRTPFAPASRRRGCQEYLSYDEFRKNGYFVIPTAKDWESDPRGHAPFAEDPKAHPMQTPNGLINFYSDELARHFPDDEERPPYPKWVETGVNHPSERLGTPRAEGLSVPHRVEPLRAGAACAARRHHVAARDRNVQGRRA